MDQPTKITADHRERQSGIPLLLGSKGIEITFCHLSQGDYMIGDTLAIERKTAEDFILSLIDGRLFSQCKKLRSSGKSCLIIVEGNPFTTNSNIKREAIQGALLSVMLSWQIPVFFTRDKNSTADILNMASCQLSRTNPILKRYKKGRRLTNHPISFISALPGVGPGLAVRMAEHFSSIYDIMMSEEKELRKVKGIGNLKARKICDFVNRKFSDHQRPNGSSPVKP